MVDSLARSNQIQSTKWSLYLQVSKQICQRWFTPPVDQFTTRLNHKVPLYVFPVPDHHAWDRDALHINWLALIAFFYHPMVLRHSVSQKLWQCNCVIILNVCPRLARDALVLVPSAALNKIPLQLPVSTILLKLSHNQVFFNKNMNSALRQSPIQVLNVAHCCLTSLMRQVLITLCHIS